MSEDALSQWSAPRPTTPVGQPCYSDLAIEPCLTLGMDFHQLLRQTQDFLRSIVRLLGVEIPVPDFARKAKY
ncbi:transposase [Sulfitobacter undariae]|uniref:transposase n=1 Tax=Sulfitobacter undariae TaxID=1563671 RepID=UPI00161244C7